jgi:DNA topoisomerase-1
LKDASELWLATDEDREGESIAWHLTEVLKAKVPIRRMVFHEITAEAISEALQRPRDLDMRLVEAQEARRILDRLYGYEVSPVLWRKIQPKLSAGRVQSVAVRILVERERERMGFHRASYWDLEGTFRGADAPERFGADLLSVDGRRVASGKDFSSEGTPTSAGVLVLGEEAARELASELEDAEARVASVERKPYRRSPYAPFRTATLQQEAGRKLRFTAARTMRAAQRLYEGGFITYMRTDSTSLAETAIGQARRLVGELYGDEFLPSSPRSYSRQVRNAQEAHEAIRPAGERWPSPQDVARQVEGDEARLYELIWKRTLASQMADARGETVQLRVATTSPAGREAMFAAGGRVITFPGFLRVYVVDRDDPAVERDDQERRLPALEEGDRLTTESMDPREHQTKPPARYTEASLIKRLEEMGVGRPSTYASIISTIQDRGYVWKRGNALIPSFLAFAAVGLLEEHFPDLVDYAFTARMEDDQDEIARGEVSSRPWLTRFYFGNGRVGLRQMVTERLEEIDAREVNSIPIGADDQGREIVVRVGRYGPYLQRGDDTAPMRDQLPPDELTVERASELLDAPSGDKILGTDPGTGFTVLARTGRYGPYVQLGDQEELDDAKPKTASLLPGMDPDELSLDVALRLLSLPRVVGNDPETGEEITAQNGRYGPYLRRGKETRSLESADHVFSVSLEDALQLFSQPKRRRGSQTATLRELGESPETGKSIELREGRYGPYVTDGDVNASLRKDDDPAAITLERALELLASRRKRMQQKKKKGR